MSASDSVWRRARARGSGLLSLVVLAAVVCTPGVAKAAGGPSSNPMNFVRMGGTTYFEVDPTQSSDGNVQLWKSDGTPGGTSLVKDLGPDTFSDIELTVVGTTLFFGADDGIHGSELWTSDGTPDGTEMLKDVKPGRNGSFPFALTAIGSSLFFFTTTDRGSLNSLWTSDGTPDGTVLLQNGVFSLPADIAQFHGKLFFDDIGEPSSNNGLWKSDGTPEGTVQVKHLSTVQNLVVLDDALYFSAFTSSSGALLWKSDGTRGGTTMVTGNGSGPSGCCYDMARFGDLILFQAADGAHGVELWKTDGTAEGTVLIKDINPGLKTNGEPRDSNPHGFVAVGGRALFIASQRGRGYELWRTNGTTAGTVMVRDIRPGAFGAFLHGNGTLSRLPGVGVVFFADDGVHGGEPWRSNGWRNGTSLIEDINEGPDLSGPTGRAITPFGPDAWFAADDGTHGDEPWLTDGEEAGTHLVDDVRT